MPHIRVRLLWALAEHMCFSGPEPLNPDEPRDPLTMLVAAMHRMLFNAAEGELSSQALQQTAPPGSLPRSVSQVWRVDVALDLCAPHVLKCCPAAMCPWCSTHWAAGPLVVHHPV